MTSEAIASGTSFENQLPHGFEVGIDDRPEDEDENSCRPNPASVLPQTQAQWPSLSTKQVSMLKMTAYKGPAIPTLNGYMTLIS